MNYIDIKKISREEAISKKLLNTIGEEVDRKYIDILKSYTIRKDLVTEHSKDLNIIYTLIMEQGQCQ